MPFKILFNCKNNNTPENLTDHMDDKVQTPVLQRSSLLRVWYILIYILVDFITHMNLCIEGRGVCVYF